MCRATLSTGPVKPGVDGPAWPGTVAPMHNWVIVLYDGSKVECSAAGYSIASDGQVLAFHNAEGAEVLAVRYPAVQWWWAVRPAVADRSNGQALASALSPVPAARDGQTRQAAAAAGGSR
jgi:hypothetical protein